MSAADENRENQAARIRWLLERADAITYLEFTMNYVREHPFAKEEDSHEHDL
jgi:hypothetical protein